MSTEIQFVDGLIVKEPHERAPDFVKARLSIKREEMIAWLQGQEGDWINADLKVARSGKWYAAVDNWKPENGGGNGGARGGAPNRQRPANATAPVSDDGFEDSIPFATNRSAW